MNTKPTRTLTIRNRTTGEVATVMDISGMTESELDKVWTGLARKVDFVKWQVVDSCTEVDGVDPATLRSIATIREIDYRSANT